MNIEILFTGIKDMSILYTRELVDEAESEFEGVSVYQKTYCGKNYCEDILKSVIEKIPEIDKLEYQQCFGRIANEIFVMLTADNIYTIACTIDTYEEKTARLAIHIESEKQGNINSVDITEKYDNNFEVYDYVLEQLKFEIKKSFEKDWKSCVWMKDEQSENLCTELYSQVFRMENRIRVFMNKVLIHELGIDWIQSPGLEKYEESYRKLAVDFRRNVPEFENIDDVLISATLETMFEIIKKAKVYEAGLQLSEEEYSSLINIPEKQGGQIHKYILNKRKVYKDLWNDVFKEYFEPVAESQQLITNCIKNRNHVAHNKFLNHSAFVKMKKSFEDMNKLIRSAEEKFESKIPSDELYETWEIERETEESEKQWERDYLRIRIQGETGVEILWHDDIFENFCERVEAMYLKISDDFYFSNMYTVGPMQEIKDVEEEQTLFSVTCNACEEYYIEIKISIIIDDGMDGDSELFLNCCIHGIDSDDKVMPSATIRYHNGAGFENLMEGYRELTSESELDSSEVSEFISEVEEYIEDLNPYVPQIKNNDREVEKNGEIPIVADFPCWECEQYGVSIDDSFYTFGHCCYCGFDNEVEICERCGAVFNDGGENNLCNSCWNEFNKE